MLKFLGSSRSRASSPSTKVSRKLRLSINIPSYGGVFMTRLRHDGVQDHHDLSGRPELLPDRELSGELEIEIPRGMGSKRVRAVRLRLRCSSRLNMGPGRGWEEDVLFERTVEVTGAIVLDEGVARFKFTIVVPFALASYDASPDGHVTLHLHAEVEGLGGTEKFAPKSATTTPAGTPRRGRSPVRGQSTNTNTSGTPAGTRPGTPSGTDRQPHGQWTQNGYGHGWAQSLAHALPGGSGGGSGSQSPTIAGGESGAVTPPSDGTHTPGSGHRPSWTSMDAPLFTEEPDDGLSEPRGVLATQMLVSWADPVQGAEGQVPWLKGSLQTSRLVALLYNPNPSNGISTLDEFRRSEVAGLGTFDVRFLSDVWTVCAFLKVQLSIPDPAPRTTIYYARVFLRQTTAITSPRDDPTVPARVSTTKFIVWEKGNRPPPVRPSRGTPCLWRGQDAGGTDKGPINFGGVGRLPNDDLGRPSTLDGILSPLKFTHALVLELWYDVFGEDAAGNPLPQPGNGQLRLMSVDKPVIVPSCAFIPEVVELPSYESHKFDTAPCPVCRLTAANQACRTCVTSVPHARHDLDPALVGNANGVCPQCEKRFITDDVSGKWADCACGRDLRQLEERMRACDGWGEAEDGAGAVARQPDKGDIEMERENSLRPSRRSQG